jgi:hypothetical protein
VISEFIPSTITAGESFDLTGTDLDLVASVKVGSTVCEINEITRNDTKLTINTPLNATGGVIEITTNNNYKTQSNGALNVDPSTKPTVTLMPASAKPGQEITLEGTNLNNVKTVIFDGKEVIKYAVRTATELTFTIPQDAPKGKYKIKFVLYEGEDVITSNEIAIVGVDPVADPSLIIFDFENGLALDGRWGEVGKESTDGGVSGKYYEITADTWDGITDYYWWFADSWRYGYPSVSSKANYVVKMDICLRKDIPAQSAEVRLMIADKVVNFLPYLLQGDVWTTGGNWKTITIPLSEWTELADPTPSTGGTWGIATWVNGANFTGFCIDNVRYERK